LRLRGRTDLGYLAGVTSNLFRAGKDGLQYFAPVGPLGPLYLVPDPATAARIQREWTRLVIGLIVALPIAGLALGPGWFVGPAWKVLLLPMLSGVLLGVSWALFSARGLPRASIAHRDLVPRGRADAHAAVGTAMGRATTRVLFSLSLMATILGALAATFSPTVVGWVGVAFFGYSSFFLYRTLKRIP
jgi:hypothetical protein